MSLRVHPARLHPARLHPARLHPARLHPAILLLVAGILLGTVALQATEIPVEPPSNIDPFADDVRDVQVVDWDGDGDLDVLTAQFNSPLFKPVRLWRNQATWLMSDWSIGVGSATDLAVGDVDGNGEPDVAYAAGPDGEVGLVLNRASDLLVTIDDALTNAQCVALADLDDDGDLDALSCDFGTGQVLVHYNTDGVGETWSTFVASSGEGAPADIFPHDVDQDGDLDLLVSTFLRVVWVENRLDEMTPTWLTHVVDSSVPGGSSVVAGDVDGDGETEIVAGSVNTALLAWWDRPAMLTTTWTRMEIQGSKAIADVVLSDSDQDGDLDILASRWDASSGELLYFENDGAAAFTERSLGGSYDILRATAVGDLDLDGDDDFVTAGGNTDVVDEIENRTIRSSVAFTDGSMNPLGGGPVPLAFRLVDLDQDGDLDILSYDDDERLRFRDDGADPGTLLQATSAELNSPDAFEVADIDHDGDMDVVMGLDDGLEWLENPGFGSQWSRNTIDTSDFVQELLVLDMNLDGQLDVVGYRTDTNELRWWRNTGEGAGWFENPMDSTISDWRGMTAGDIEGDRRKEVIVSSDSAVTAYSYFVDTVFIQTQIAVSKADELAAADFDRDGDIDVMGYDNTSPQAFFMYWANDGSGGGWDEDGVEAPSDLDVVRVADMDLDGDLDLVASGAQVSTFVETTDEAFPDDVQDYGGFESTLLVLGDVDGDGYLDGVGVSGSSIGLAPTFHGQFGMSAASGPGDVDEGAFAELMTFSVRHLGRDGDQDVEMVEFHLEVTSGGVPLTGPEIDALFESVVIFRNDGSDGTIAELMQPDQASPLHFVVSVSDGKERVVAPTGGSLSAADLRVRAQLEADAADTVSQFELHLLGTSDDVAEDPMGTPLALLPWGGASREYTVNEMVDPLIFTDDFESGDTSGWSSVVGN